MSASAIHAEPYVPPPRAFYPLAHRPACPPGVPPGPPPGSSRFPCRKDFGIVGFDI